jgi:WD40-like Beta Propeller Repeat
VSFRVAPPMRFRLALPVKRSFASLLGAALLSGLVICPSAGADVFGPIELVSGGFLEGSGAGGQQALYAHDPALSASGEYVAFDGYFAGRTGVWRRDLETEEVQPVAVGAVVPGSEPESCEQPACDAKLPSISENGQYISFTTTAPLDPEDDRNSAPDVYVRNMDVPESQAGAYTLVSAVNGKAEGLSYEGSSGYGSVAAGRSAISATGEEVAFVTTAVSNLAACQPGAPPESACGASSPEAPEPTTPALQVAVRDLAKKETRLVSEEYDPVAGAQIPDKPVSEREGDTTYGAVYSSGGAPPEFSAFEHRAYTLPPTVGASISADGTTVAWMGTNVSKQARTFTGEAEAKYAEPLWRRIADGPTPTRRVTGGSEPENPLCLASGETELPYPTAPGPCQGPFATEPSVGVWSGEVGNTVPQLSEDGYTVAFVATAPLVALGADFGRGAEGESDDLYVADMSEGLTRNQALRPLTEVVSGSLGSEAIVDLAVSPDGSQVAFSTGRTEFPLGSPAYVSQPQAVLGMVELFDVDLDNDTLTRVTRGYEGGPSEHPHEQLHAGEPAYKSTDGALSPSFSKDGDTLAFSSTASNLAYGDGNTPPVTINVPTGAADGGDVFVVPRVTYPPEPVETYLSGTLANPSLAPRWSLGATALSLENGSVRLYVEVPGAGELSAAADSAVSVVTAAHAVRASAKRGHASSGRGRSAGKVTTVAIRDVASAKQAIGADSGGFVALTLTLAPRYRTLAARSDGLSGTVHLIFTAPGEKALTDSIAVEFVSRVKASAKKRAKKASSSKHPAASRAKGRR